MIIFKKTYFFFQITGPAFPDSDYNGDDGCIAMVTSPTNKGVVACSRKSNLLFFELSGDSEENLTWSVLDHSLPYYLNDAVAFTIPNHCIPSHNVAALKN